MKTITILRGTDGINNRVNQTRIHFSQKTGLADLAAGVNVDIDDDGAISRRLGTNRVIEGAWHSLFSADAFALGVKGGGLYLIDKGWGITGIRNVTPGKRVRYAMGHDGDQPVVYYVNGADTPGRVTFDGVSRTWTKGTYVGPDTTREFSDPPIGHLICLFAGRAWIAVDNHLFYSEPFALGRFCLSDSWQMFPGRLRMVAAADGGDGLWVGTNEGVWSVLGTNPREMVPRRRSSAPVLEGSEVQVDLEKFGDGEMAGNALMFTTESGICLGANQGTLVNVTHSRLNYTATNKGAGLYRDGDSPQYLCSMEP
jgi:hypothetical protein